ncbi:MAG: lipase family alpha/beta hydrolase [Streptosporangiaceae bacterium]
MRGRGGGWGLAGLSPRRRMFFVGTCLVVAAAVIVVGLKIAGVFSPAAARANPAVPTVVVLVPGYGGNTAGVDVLAAHIRGFGMSTEVVSLPGSGTGDLGAQAVVLNGYLNRALHSGAGQVDIVGYSAGGVVTRLWDEQDDGAAKIHRIITLGSPLNGTRIAAAGNAADPGACPQACQELVPGSTLLTKLHSVPLGSRPGWLSLWTTDDQTVRPPTSAHLAGAVNLALQSVCPGIVIAHSQLPTSPLVIGIVLRALAAGPLTAPGRGDCAQLQALGNGPTLGAS